jgi:NTE family protein
MSNAVPAAIEPVSRPKGKAEDQVEEGVGLAVSGGSYRAMLFHLGAFLRLHELGLLRQIDRISSVSGGSITAAKIALEWDRLDGRDAFFRHVVAPVRKLAGTTIDWTSTAAGIFLPGYVADRISAQYRKHLFGDATLQDLPDEPAAPRFVINASNLETGALWRFSKPYMGDWKLGRVMKPTVSLADAVTASSAFPPVLSPFVLQVDKEDFEKPTAGLDPRFFDEISLTDGGVYDNLGLETVWKNYRTVLVSDAGAANALDPSPAGNWASLAKRVLDIVHEQVSSIRKRQVIASYQLPEGDEGHRRGAYWGIRTDIRNYKLDDALDAPLERTRELAATPTRLKRLGSAHQERLINWGYAVCDAGVRKHWPPADGPGRAFPYPDIEV